MMTGKRNLLALALCAASSVAYAGACDQYLQDNGTTSGVIPNFNEDGTMRSLSLFAEQTFLVPKRSLVNKARTMAQNKASREFSTWIKQSVESNTLQAELMEQAETTTSDGVTSGQVEEITKFADVISSNTSSVLSGIIKLDECMDPEQKVIMVRMGWKASLSEAAADARATIDNNVARGESGASTSESSATSASQQVQGSEGYRAKSSLADKF